MATKKIIGTIMMIPSGDWNSVTEYKILNIVRHNDTVYVAKKDNVNTAVTDTATWFAMGKFGADGNDGDDGADGKSLVVLSNGNIGFWDDTAQDYVDSGITASATVDLQNATVTFTEAQAVSNIESGETVPTIFGKIKKWFASLGALSAKDKADWLTDIDNKPTKLSDFSNIETGFITQSAVTSAISTHGSDSTTHQDIRMYLSDVEAIARGKSRSWVFDTVSDLDTWLTVTANVDELLIGDNFLIRATDVPDYWWDGTQKLPSEVEKVDLTNIYTKSEADGIFLKSITKSMIEAQLTGLVTSHTHNYQPTEAGKGLSSYDFDRTAKGKLDFMDTDSAKSSLSSMAITKHITPVTISSNQSFSVGSVAVDVLAFVVVVTATAAVTVVMPNTSDYINMGEASYDMAIGDSIEIHVLVVNGKYHIKVQAK